MQPIWARTELVYALELYIGKCSLWKELDFCLRMRTCFWYSIFILWNVLHVCQSKSADKNGAPEWVESDDGSGESVVELNLNTIIKQEGGLIHNVFKLMRLEISILNAIEKRLHGRVKRAKNKAHSDRFEDIQSYVDDTKSVISGQLRVIKNARKIWSVAKASTKRCESFGNMKELIDFHPEIMDQIVSNGDLIGNATMKLESEKNSLLSRKMKFGSIIGDSPQLFADLGIVQTSLKQDGAVLGRVLASMKELTVNPPQACTSDESASSVDEDSDSLVATDD